MLMIFVAVISLVFAQKYPDFFENEDIKHTFGRFNPNPHAHMDKAPKPTAPRFKPPPNRQVYTTPHMLGREFEYVPRPPGLPPGPPRLKRKPWGKNGVPNHNYDVVNQVAQKYIPKNSKGVFQGIEEIHNFEDQLVAAGKWEEFMAMMEKERAENKTDYSNFPENFERWKLWLKDTLEDEKAEAEEAMREPQLKKKPSIGFEAYWANRDDPEEETTDKAGILRQYAREAKKNNIPVSISGQDYLKMAMARAKSIQQGNYYPPPLKMKSPPVTPKNKEYAPPPPNKNPQPTQLSRPNPGPIPEMPSTYQQGSPMSMQSMGPPTDYSDYMGGSPGNPQMGSNPFQQGPGMMGGLQGDYQMGMGNNYQGSGPMGMGNSYQGPGPMGGSQGNSQMGMGNPFQGPGPMRGSPGYSQMGSNPYQQRSGMMGGPPRSPGNMPMGNSFDRPPGMSGPSLQVEANPYAPAPSLMKMQRAIGRQGNRLEEPPDEMEQKPAIGGQGGFAKQDFEEAMKPIVTGPPPVMLSSIPPFAKGSPGEKYWLERIKNKFNPDWPSRAEDIPDTVSRFMNQPEQPQQNTGLRPTPVPVMGEGPPAEQEWKKKAIIPPQSGRSPSINYTIDEILKKEEEDEKMQEYNLRSLPTVDDFRSPIRWVKFNSNETEDGLAKVTDPKTGANLQVLIKGTIYVPVTDYNLERLGLTTKKPEEKPKMPVEEQALYQVLLKNMDINKMGQMDWLAMEVSMGGRDDDSKCQRDVCQSRCSRTACDTACSGDTCAAGCVGDACTAMCKGPGCFAMCIGEECTAVCEGLACDTRCRGRGCDAKCRKFQCHQTINGAAKQGPGGTFGEHYPQYDTPNADGPGWDDQDD